MIDGLLAILVQEKTGLILYQCSKCSYQVNNNHQHFLNHLDHQHPDLLEVNLPDCFPPRIISHAFFSSFRMQSNSSCQISPSFLLSRSFFRFFFFMNLPCRYRSSCIIDPVFFLLEKKTFTHTYTHEYFGFFFFLVFFRCFALFYSHCH